MEDWMVLDEKVFWFECGSDDFEHLTTFLDESRVRFGFLG